VKQLITILSFLLTASAAPAQQAIIDSLKTVLKTLPNDTVKANLLIDIGRKNYALSNFDEAFLYGSEALKLSQSLSFKNGTATAYHILGVVSNVRDEYDKALEYYNLALKLQTEIGDKKAITKTLNNMGIVYKDMGDYPTSIEYNLKALKIREAMDDKVGIAASLMTIGIVYDMQDQQEKALEYYKQSLQMREKLGDKMGIAACLNNIGSVYESDGDTEKALEHYLRSLKIKEEIGDKDGIANTMMNIGNVYSVRGDNSKSLFYLTQSLNIKKELGDTYGIAMGLGNIGKIYERIGDNAKAIEYYKNSLKMSEEADLKNMKKESARFLYNVYERTGDYKQALSYYKMHIRLRDSLINEENNSMIAKMNAEFESEKKDNQIRLLNKDKEKQQALAAEERKRNNIIIASVSGGLLLVVLLALFIFRGYRQKQKANIEITRQKEIIEEKSREVHDSITYAKRIQTAILPPMKKIHMMMKDAFVLFIPKDIVSGDFYWVEKINGKLFFAVVDCTGHGVPGAMVSVVGHSALNRCVKEFGMEEPGLILDQLTKLVEETFENSESEVKDGMDISLCCFDPQTGLLKWAGANNPLWIFRAQEFTEIKADKQPVGKFDNRKPFHTHTIQLSHGDAVYLFTDGYADQFGGEKGKKFKYKQLADLLKEMYNLPMDKQKAELEKAFNNWKGELEQIDDICLLGFRYS
jgi:tetratricopeptide (TPR) repeat protein